VPPSCSQQHQEEDTISAQRAHAGMRLDWHCASGSRPRKAIMWLGTNFLGPIPSGFSGSAAVCCHSHHAKGVALLRLALCADILLPLAAAGCRMATLLNTSRLELPIISTPVRRYGSINSRAQTGVSSDVSVAFLSMMQPCILRQRQQREAQHTCCR
jgi:hypothetical protein